MYKNRHSHNEPPERYRIQYKTALHVSENNHILNNNKIFTRGQDVNILKTWLRLLTYTAFTCLYGYSQQQKNIHVYTFSFYRMHFSILRKRKIYMTIL